MRRLFIRDLQLAVRAGGGFGLGLAFFLVLIVLVALGVGPNPELLTRIGPGIIWVGALLSCLLSLDRLFQLDFEDGSLDLLATAPIPLEGVVLAKAAAHWVTTGLPLALLAPLLGFMLHLPQEAYLWVTVSLLIGTPALSMIGAFGAGLTVGLKRGGLLLSLLVLPLYLPSLIYGASVVRRAADALSFSAPLMLIGVITLACWAVLPFVTAAVLRVNLR